MASAARRCVAASLWPAVLVLRTGSVCPGSSEIDAAVDAAKLTHHHHLPGWHSKGVRGRQA